MDKEKINYEEVIKDLQEKIKEMDKIKTLERNLDDFSEYVERRI